MYSRPVTDEDVEKYKTLEDDSDVKYIFDSYGDHL
ncbi:unknown [Clostridium sp. CAG:813]|nr:unknown [Clostridium sp. CAG:813]